MMNRKKTYVAPEVQVLEVIIEQGFALSPNTPEDPYEPPTIDW